MPAPADTRLYLDVMLGGLVSPLRMVGYDTAYALDRGTEADDRIIEAAESEDRVLLTRDVAAAGRAAESVCLESLDPGDQLEELAAAGFDLTLTEPSRCSQCNGALERVDRGPGPENGPDPTERPVWRCRDCGQYYWIGSHWTNLRARLPDD
ncbi:MAG: Mut7-C RNAse domain-containing protein [Halodesulfurarchaeum sp.]